MAKEEQIIDTPVENTAQSRQKKRIKKKTQMRLGPKLNERELATESSSQITEPNISKNDVFEISKQVKSFNKFFKSKLWTAPEKELTEGELIEKRNMLKAIKTFKTEKKTVAKLVEIHPKIEKDISEVKDVSNDCKGNSDYSTARSHFSTSSFNSKSESENILSSPAIAKSYTAVSSSTSDSSDNNELKNNVTNEEQKSQCVSVEESPIKDVDNVTNNDDVTEQTESNVGIVKDPILQQEKDDFKSMHGHLQTRTANAKNSDSQIIKNRSDHSKMNKKRQTCRIPKISQTKRRIGTQSIQSHRVKSSKTKTSKELGSELDSKNQISSLTARFNGQEKDKFKNADSSIVKIPKAPEAGQNEKKYGTPKVFSNNVKETPEKLNELIETSMMVEEHSPQRSTEEIDGVDAHRTITTNDSDASKVTESEGEMGIDCHPESSDRKGNCGSNHRSIKLTNDLSEMEMGHVDADQIIHSVGSSQDESRAKRFLIPKKARSKGREKGKFKNADSSIVKIPKASEAAQNKKKYGTPKVFSKNVKETPEKLNELIETSMMVEEHSPQRSTEEIDGVEAHRTITTNDSDASKVTESEGEMGIYCHPESSDRKGNCGSNHRSIKLTNDLSEMEMGHVDADQIIHSIGSSQDESRVKRFLIPKKARSNGREKGKFKNADSSIVKIPKAPEAAQNEKKYGTPKVFSKNVKQTPEKLNELIETSMMVEEHSPQRSTEEIDGVEADRTSITSNNSDASKVTESEGEMGIDTHPESSDRKGNCGSNHRSIKLTNDLSEIEISLVDADQIIHSVGSSQDESHVKRFVIPKKARSNGREKGKFKNADSIIVKIPKTPEAGQNEKKYGTPKVFSKNVKETPEKLNELIKTSMMVEEHSPQRSTEEIDGVEAHRTITTNDSDASKGTESEGEMGIDCHPESSDRKGNCGSNHRSNNLTNDLSEMEISLVDADQIIHSVGSSQDESRVKRFVTPKKVRQYQSSDSMSPLHNDVSAVLRSLNSKPPLADSTIECGNTSEAGKLIRRSVKKKSCQSPYPRPFNEDGDKNEKESRIVDWGSQEKTTSGKKRKGIHPTMGSSKMLVDKSLGLIDPDQSGIFFKKKRFNASTKTDFVSTSSGILEIESQKKVPEPLLEFKETPRKSKIQSTDFLNFVNNPTYLSTSDSDSTNQSDDGVLKKPVVEGGRSPREKYQTHCKNKQQSPNISVQSLHKSDKMSLFDRPPAPSEHLEVTVNPRVAPSIFYPSKQQIKGVNATITHKSSDTVNKFGLSPRGARQNDCSRIHRFQSFEDTEKLESVYSPSLDYDYDPSAFSPQVTKQSDDSGTISTKLPTAGKTSLVASYSSSNDCSEDSSSEDETLCGAQTRESTLNYGRSQTSEAVYDDHHEKQGEFGSQRGGLNLHSPLKNKRHRSRVECRSNKFDPSNMPGFSAEIGRDVPSVLPGPSCVDDDLEWEKYRVNWDEPTYFDGENSFGVFYNDPLSHKKAEEWTNNLLKLLKTTPISILKKKPSIESFIKTSARQVRLFDTLFGNPSAHAPSQSTMKIIMESICSNYWNGEFCDKTCRKKHKMICDDFPPLSSDEVYLIVSARLMELKKPPLPMVSSLIEWLAEHKETTKLLSFSKILFTDKGLALSTKICSVFIDNMAKFYEMEASSVVEYLLKFHYFLIKKQHSRIVPVLNKLIEYCQVGTYKHKVYSIVKFLLDNEKYTLPFSILDKLLHEVNSNPPSDIMETKDKIKSQLRFHEKSEDQNFRSRACTFLRTYFPVSH